MTKVLAGVKVIDMTEGVAGPYAATSLGDMGADVIKVERLEGDWGRTAGRVDPTSPFGSLFIALNRNKRNLGLDLRTTGALQVMQRLLNWSDVFISNFRPGVMQSFKLDYENCRLVNSEIIYCTISAFGQEGGYAHLPGSDTVLQAMSGFMNLIGEPSGPPLRLGFPLIDMAAASYAVQGILLALYQRKMEHVGANIDVSLMNAAAAIMTIPYSEYLLDNRLPNRPGNQNPYLSPAGAFLTADKKYITLAVLRESHWKKFCAAVNRPELEKDPLFADNTQRLKHRESLNRILESLFLKRTSSEWIEKLREADIICAPLNQFDEIINDPNFRSTMPLLDVSLSTGTVKVIGLPILFDGQFFPADTPPPRKGEHSMEVLSELGFSVAETTDLLKSRSVFTCEG